MYLAREYMKGNDLVFLHGDLVFNRKLVRDVLSADDKNTATVNFKKALPEKDFKGRVQDGKVLEVSINIFDADCFVGSLPIARRATVSLFFKSRIVCCN